ncbi:unnamed protein product [Meloidogyne enterolobii]|uniref:Uncharacterized protein n=1 Tax=Meloidogyne enterolobii TaxID=390850 RepID=A0ACB0Z0Q0_MELEN
MEQITKNFNNEENDVANDSQVDSKSLNDVKCDVCPTTSLFPQPFSLLKCFLNLLCLLDSFSIGDFIRCSTKSSHFSGELILNDVTNGILLLEEYLNNGRSTLHFVKKCGLLTIEKIFPPQKMQKRRSSNLIKHNNSLYTIDEIERTESVLESDYFIKDEQAKRTFLELKRMFVFKLILIFYIPFHKKYILLSLGILTFSEIFL